MSVVTSKAQGANLNFVTAIVDSELEAAVAQLLYSHGNNIIFRALTFSALQRFLIEGNLDFQVIYSDDFADETEFNNLNAEYRQIKFTKVETGFNAAQFLIDISQIARQPLVRKLQRLPNLISIMGSFGSPGISIVTNQIAARFSDATILHPEGKNFQSEISRNNKALEATEKNRDALRSHTERYFLDAGATLTLTTTLSDRRYTGKLLNWALNSSAKIIYVIKPDERGISSLTNFLIDYQNLISPPPLISILNQQRFNAKARLINTEFQRLTSGQSNFQVPFDHPATSRYPTGKQWWSTTFAKQFDQIANSLV
ncbi:MAG: hypothetical protein EBS18_01070 [Actinobacteria bacterium]|nr:hypothetical protein [Actinomycetota bacterium]